MTRNREPNTDTRHVYRKRVRTVTIGAILAASLFSARCDAPSIQGTKTMAVGQRVEVEVAQGPALLQGEFELKDASGQVYGATDPRVAYNFLDSRNISFLIPPGIASGPASVKLGSDGRSQGYTLKLTILRMAAVMNEDGRLTAVDVDTGRSAGHWSLGHGNFSFRMSRDGSRMLATATAEHAVHFLHLGAQGIEPYSPSVEGIGVSPVDAVFLDDGALVATEQGLSVVHHLGNGSTVLEGFLDTGPVDVLTGSPEAGRVVALGRLTDATDFSDLLWLVELEEDGPRLVEDPIVLDPAALGWQPATGWDAGGYASPVLSSNGQFLFVTNRISNRIAVIDPATGQLMDYEDLPLEGELLNADPFRLRLTYDETKMVVLCGESSTAVVYNVTNGTLQHAGTRVSESVPWDVGFAGTSMAYLVTDAGVFMFDLNNPANGTWAALSWQDTTGAVRMAVQP